MPPVNRLELLRRASSAAIGAVLGRSLQWLPAQPVLDAADVAWTPASFPTQSVVFLDQGTLELGLMRDSVLRDVYDHKVYDQTTRDFALFGETFESAARLGPDRVHVTAGIDPMRRDPREVLAELRAVSPDEHALLTEQIVL